MSESTMDSAPATSPVLSYLTDQTYRPIGELSIGIATAVLFGGIAAAAVSALITFTWFRARLPTPFFLPFLIQAGVVALPLAWLIHRLKVNNLRFAVAAAIVSGASCVVLFYLAQYVHNVYVFRDAIHHHWNSLGSIAANSASGRSVIAEVDAHPFAVFDRRVVFPRTHAHGFVGYLILRGQKVWVIGSLQAIFIAWMAVKRGRKVAGRPLCANCHTWFKDSVSAAIVPAQSVDALCIAIDTEDLVQLDRFSQIVDAPLGYGCAVARIYDCPSCERHLVEVVILNFGRRRNRERIALSPRQISSAAAGALRARVISTRSLELDGGAVV